MMSMKKDGYRPDRKLAAACGLFCPACRIFIATRETLEEREKIAQNLKLSVEALNCDGCRSDNRFSYCKTCKLITCATEKGLEFCGTCADYPCEELKQFQAAKPHRLELWQAQARIKEVGYEQWFEEMLEYYSCGQCSTINSAYDLTCCECGAMPSNAYVRSHKAEIVAYLKNSSR